jgi:hypothetical protein
MSTGTQRTQRSQTAQGKARAAKRLMPYPEERALEHTVHALEAVPTRIHSVLLPVWCVEVEADVTEGEPYELIDRFLERGIAEAGLGTVGELAAFFALDPPLVGQAVRFLTAIGHVTEGDGRLSLTELGYRSVRDEVRYVVTRKDRRKLYFDGFDSRPLTRPYYDARKVGFLSGETLQEALERRDGPRLNMLNPSRDFRREALVELADSPERDRFNLPGRIDAPRAVGSADLVFLPAYLVRAVERGGRVRHFAYTPAADEYDPEITAACEAAADVVSALEAEEVAAARGDFAAQAGRWLSKRGLAEHRPARTGDGAWRVSLPGSSFGGDGPVPFAKLGSYVVLGTGFFQVWCREKLMRMRALVERINSYAGSRARVDADVIREKIDAVSRQLELGTVDLDTVRRAAADAGRRELAAQLSRLL